ncbi:MAG: hypothetical protein ACI9JR_002892 [Gammaproteobacteria bacterium]|jgi:hypothetical protein
MRHAPAPCMDCHGGEYTVLAYGGIQAEV